MADDEPTREELYQEIARLREEVAILTLDQMPFGPPDERGLSERDLLNELVQADGWPGIDILTWEWLGDLRTLAERRIPGSSRWPPGDYPWTADLVRWYERRTAARRALQAEQQQLDRLRLAESGSAAASDGEG